MLDHPSFGTFVAGAALAGKLQQRLPPVRRVGHAHDPAALDQRLDEFACRLETDTALLRQSAERQLALGQVRQDTELRHSRVLTCFQAQFGADHTVEEWQYGQEFLRGLFGRPSVHTLPVLSGYLIVRIPDNRAMSR